MGIKDFDKAIAVMKKIKDKQYKIDRLKDDMGRLEDEVISLQNEFIKVENMTEDDMYVACAKEREQLKYFKSTIDKGLYTNSNLLNGQIQGAINKLNKVLQGSKVKNEYES